jgi:phosphoglucomutase/phosphomannomutase
MRRYGCHVERAFSLRMPGAEGMDRMRRVMAAFRSQPPVTLGGLQVVKIRDYGSQVARALGGASVPLAGPKGDLVMLDLATDGNYVAVRPSGTEPLVKFYLFAYQPPQSIADLNASRARLAAQLEAAEADLRTYVSRSP